MTYKKRLLLGLVLLSVAGCRDPASERRIKMRLANLDATATDSVRDEQRHARRVGEALETADKWLRSDTERFFRRLPTVGDYIW